MILETSPNVYTPQEDTFFFQDVLIDFFSKEGQNVPSSPQSICELGCGSGYLSIQFSKLFPESLLTLVDINSEALQLSKHNFELNTINLEHVSFFESDLFSVFKNYPKIHTQFDLIIFNPPYIPKKQDSVTNDIERAWHGGDGESSIIKRFLRSVSKYLRKKSYVFILITSFNTRDAHSIDDMIKKTTKTLKIIKIYEKKINFENLFLVILGKFYSTE